VFVCCCCCFYFESFEIIISKKPNLIVLGLLDLSKRERESERKINHNIQILKGIEKERNNLLSFYKKKIKINIIKKKKIAKVKYLSLSFSFFFIT
jgi:hypothetical protein